MNKDEKLFNEYATKLRQEYNKHHAEVKQIMGGLDEQIRALVKEELAVHLESIHLSLELISGKIRKHFGT